MFENLTEGDRIACSTDCIPVPDYIWSILAFCVTVSGHGTELLKLSVAAAVGTGQGQPPWPRWPRWYWGRRPLRSPADRPRSCTECRQSSPGSRLWTNGKNNWVIAGWFLFGSHPQDPGDNRMKICDFLRPCRLFSFVCAHLANLFWAISNYANRDRLVFASGFYRLHRNNHLLEAGRG